MAKMEKFNQPLNKPFAGLKNQIEEKKEKEKEEFKTRIEPILKKLESLPKTSCSFIPDLPEINEIIVSKEKDSNEATVFIQYNKEIENKGKKGKHSVKTLTRGTITKENGLIISLPEELRHLNSKQILKEIIDSIELM